MAYSVINGAIGKNPIIENMNQSLIFHSEDHISKQMEKIAGNMDGGSARKR